MSRLHASIPSWWKRHKLIFNRCIIVYFHILCSKKSNAFYSIGQGKHGIAECHTAIQPRWPTTWSLHHSSAWARARARARAWTRAWRGELLFITVKCRSNAVQYNMVLHTPLQWLRENIHVHQNLNPQTHPIPRPNVWAMGCVCEDSEYLIARVITTTRCIFN